MVIQLKLIKHDMPHNARCHVLRQSKWNQLHMAPASCSEAQCSVALFKLNWTIEATRPMLASGSQRAETPVFHAVGV